MTLQSKLGSGREAEVFVGEGDTVVKLYRPGFRGHEPEAAALTRLEGLGVAPRLIEVVERDQRRGLVLERLQGADMLAALQQRPWQLPGLARQLAQTHLRIHDVDAPKALPDLREVMAARIYDAPMPSQLRDFALQLLSMLPSGDRLIHGDFHPGNVLIDGERAGVIDWGSAARGAPEADHARTILLLKWADPLPGTPLLARGLIATGRSIFARGYTRSYRRDASRSLHQLSSWLTVNVAARMNEGIDVEHPKLLRLLEAAQRRDQRLA